MNFESHVAPNFKFSGDPDPDERAYSAPPDPLAGGQGLAAPPKNPTPALGRLGRALGRLGRSFVPPSL